MNRILRIFFVIVIILCLIMAFLFFIRFFNTKEIDDVNPNIYCERELIDKVDVLWVIPNYKNRPIDMEFGWCKEIKKLNKTLGLHGYTHEYMEFGIDRTQNYLNEAMGIFERCFGETPTMFKAPQLEISHRNRILIKKNMVLKSYINQITHKVYHCSDTGKYPNWLIDLF